MNWNAKKDSTISRKNADGKKTLINIHCDAAYIGDTMMHDPGIKYVDLPEGIYPTDFTEIVVGKNGIERVFYVIGRGGLLEQPLSQDLKVELVERISDYVSETYNPKREALRKDVEQLLLNKNFPDALAHARHNGDVEKSLSDECRIAMDSLFFCFKRNDGGLLKETKKALLYLIDEAELYSLKAGARPTVRLSDQTFNEILWEILRAEKGGIIRGDLYAKLDPFELKAAMDDLSTKKDLRKRVNGWRMQSGSLPLETVDDIIIKQMNPEDELKKEYVSSKISEKCAIEAIEMGLKLTEKYLELIDARVKNGVENA